MTQCYLVRQHLSLNAALILILATPVKFRDSIKTNTAHGHVRGPLHLHLAGEGIIQVGVEVKSEQMILESFAEHEE